MEPTNPEQMQQQMTGAQQTAAGNDPTVAAGVAALGGAASAAPTDSAAIASPGAAPASAAHTPAIEPKAASPTAQGGAAPVSASPHENPAAKVLHGILGALGGTTEVSYRRATAQDVQAGAARNEGELIVSKAAKQPGQQWKQIIAGALTGAAAGAGVKPGPGQKGRAAAAGMAAGFGVTAGQDANKRAQANDDFAAEQKAMMTKANVAKLTAETAKIGFEGKRLGLQVNQEYAKAWGAMSAALAKNPNNHDLGTFSSMDEFLKTSPQLQEQVAKQMPHGMVQPVILPDGSVQAFAINTDWDKQPLAEDRPLPHVVGYEKDGTPKIQNDVVKAGTMSEGDYRKALMASHSEYGKSALQVYKEQQNSQRNQTTANAHVEAARIAAASRKDVADINGRYRENAAVKKAQGAGLTTSTRTMMEAAPKVMDFVDRINGIIDRNKQNLGPVASRWQEFMAGKVGAPNEEFTKLRTDTQLLSTLLMRMHVGARGGEKIMEHFKDLINSGHQSPENLKAALSEIRTYAEWVRDTKPPGSEGGTPANTPAPAGGGTPGNQTLDINKLPLAPAPGGRS